MTAKQPGNISNLKPFKKGVSGNPGGKPKGWVNVSALVRSGLTEPCVEGSPVTHAQMIAGVLLKLASQGEAWAVKEVLDRTEGKSVARTENGDPGAFEELAGKSVDELRAMLKAVK